MRNVAAAPLPTAAKHSSQSDDWGTPLHVLARVRTVFGGSIDFDPASDAEANLRVGATSFLTREEDAFRSPWKPGSVFVNPPGGKYPKGHEFGGRSRAGRFWDRLMTHREFVRGFTHGIFLCFSLEALQTTQKLGGFGASAASFPLCVPRLRLRFIGRGGAEETRPTHANALVYVPGSVDRTEDFAETFLDLGEVLVPFAAK